MKRKWKEVEVLGLVISLPRESRSWGFYAGAVFGSILKEREKISEAKVS